MSGSNLYLKENILKIDGSEIEIILNPGKILNYKKLYYKKIIINGGTTKINTNNINYLLNYFKKNKLKIFFKENNLTIIKNKISLFEINDGAIKISPTNKQQPLSINGTFLNHKIIFILDNKSGNKKNILIKIPKLDIFSNISLQNKDNFNFFSGLVNLEVLNNFFQFNFTREKNIEINKGFIRNNLISSSFEGEVALKPSFLLNLNFEPTILNMEKLFSIINKKYFSDEVKKPELINKINGLFVFKKMFYGDVTFQNGEILFKNFKKEVNSTSFFNAKITEFGKKGKIYFNILKVIQHRKSSSKNLKIAGFIVPHSSEIVFEKILFGKEKYTKKKIRNSEEKFKKEVIQKSLSNIFNDKKMNNFFNSFKY